MDNKKVSIIVPVYNTENYLEKCISSLLEQTYTNMEIILIDDGSTDKSGLICDAYLKYDNIKVIHKENGGISSARNLGLDYASGEFVFFVDSDDHVENDYIETLIVKENEDFVQGLYNSVDDAREGVWSKEEVFEDFARYSFETPVQFVWCNCYKKQIIDKFALRFDEKVILGEDGRWNLNYLKHVSFIRREKKVPYYHCDNTQSAVHKLYLNRLEIQKAECQLIEEVSKNMDSMMRLKWYYWHIALNHYKHHIKKGNKELKYLVKRAYADSYFRECIPYIRKSGSLDEKIEARIMRYEFEWIYKLLVGLLGTMSKIKRGKSR